MVNEHNFVAHTDLCDLPDGGGTSKTCLGGDIYLFIIELVHEVHKIFI